MGIERTKNIHERLSPSSLVTLMRERTLLASLVRNSKFYRPNVVKPNNKWDGFYQSNLVCSCDFSLSDEHPLVFSTNVHLSDELTVNDETTMDDQCQPEILHNFLFCYLFFLSSVGNLEINAKKLNKISDLYVRYLAQNLVPGTRSRTNVPVHLIPSCRVHSDGIEIAKGLLTHMFRERVGVLTELL